VENEPDTNLNNFGDANQNSELPLLFPVRSQPQDVVVDRKTGMKYLPFVPL
jgi:hypothetical protein